MTTSQYVLDAGPMISTSDDFASLPAATDWVKVSGDYVAQVVGQVGADANFIVERTARDPASPAGPAIAAAPNEVGGAFPDAQNHYSSKAWLMSEPGFAWVRVRLLAGTAPFHVSISGRTW